MQGVLRHASGGSGLLYTQAVLVIHELNSLTGLLHLLQLSAILPSVGPGPIVQWVTDLVVGNAHTINSSELVAPEGGYYAYSPLQHGTPAGGTEKATRSPIAGWPQ